MVITLDAYQAVLLVQRRPSWVEPWVTLLSLMVEVLEHFERTLGHVPRMKRAELVIEASLAVVVTVEHLQIECVVVEVVGRTLVFVESGEGVEDVELWGVVCVVVEVVGRTSVFVESGEGVEEVELWGVNTSLVTAVVVLVGVAAIVGMAECSSSLLMVVES